MPSTSERTDDPRRTLAEMYAAAVAGADPAQAVERALVHSHPPPSERVWIVAIGKAGLAMARGALRFLEAQHTAPIGGLIVTADGSGPPPSPSPSPYPPPFHPAIRLAIGDHPVPGGRSLEASTELGRLTEAIRPGDQAWVLLSGGTTSLIASPVDGIPAGDLQELYRLLLGSGLDIVSSNLVRKRVARWGAGRLGLAFDRAGAHARVYVLSDVLGDDLSAIGSGPCVADPSTASDVRGLLENHGRWSEIPASVRGLIERAAEGREEDTPKPPHHALAAIPHFVIGNNAVAQTAAEAHAVKHGFTCETLPEPVTGEAAAAGRRFVAELERLSGRPERSLCVVAGGETTVTLARTRGIAKDGGGRGGRCQEFALAAAAALAERPGAHRWTILAAGTDGRDGPTDAAGGVVDSRTWARAEQAGRDPGHDLRRHAAYEALSAAGALFKPGPTGTNVLDLILAVRRLAPNTDRAELS